MTSQSMLSKFRATGYGNSMKQRASATCRAQCAKQCPPRRGMVRLRVSMPKTHGVNSQLEMACVITPAGFETQKVHMSDWQAVRARLDVFICAGLSLRGQG